MPLKTGTIAQNDGTPSDKDHPSVLNLLQQVKDVKKEDAAIKSEKKYSLTNQEQDSDDTPCPPRKPNSSRILRLETTTAWPVQS